MAALAVIPGSDGGGGGGDLAFAVDGLTITAESNKGKTRYDFTNIQTPRLCCRHCAYASVWPFNKAVL